MNKDDAEFIKKVKSSIRITIKFPKNFSKLNKVIGSGDYKLNLPPININKKRI